MTLYIYLQSSNVSTIIVTHDPFEAMFISNQINIMDDQWLKSLFNLVAPADLYNNPKNEYVTRFFGETNVFKGNVQITLLLPLQLVMSK